ncbi:hypothetical protein [Pseudophaeobacter sp.]|uniref:hypothetical protein n=1 Tax=Pseudophaeobacter sp. TaxID=1971739 RepID=UPI003A977D19
MTVSFQRSLITGVSSLGLMAGALGLSSGGAQADQVISDDLIVGSSLCLGMDCVNGENFGFDTLRLKENNLRIRFQDTSNSGSFPTNDWQITVNDTSNGGLNKFSIDDIDGGRTPFTIEALAPSHSLYLDDGGRIGLGTSTPVVEAHVVDGDTPTLRLEQDGSSGFTPQTWDLASNETNFFIRDATNGSRLPFKIRPSAPTNALYIDTDGDIGFGTASPDAALHVVGNSNMLIEDSDTGTAPTEMLEVRGNILASGGGDLMVSNAGEATVTLSDTSDPGPDFKMRLLGGTFRLSFNGTGDAELELDEAGNVTIPGSLITTGGGGACTLADPCDAVFDPEIYQVPSIEDHAAQMWADKHLPAVGPTGPGIPVNVSHKMLRMLNELETAHIYIEQLNSRISELETHLQGG